MIQAVLVLLGLFVIVSVIYNIWSMKSRQTSITKNTVFSGSPTIEVMKPSREVANLEPIIDVSISARETQEPRFSAQRTVQPQVQREPAVQQPAVTASTAADPEESTLVSLYIMNEPKGTLFASHDLIQALSAAHCHFGEMSIFHRHEQLNGRGEVLFSIAQAVKPGIFNLNDIDSIRCPGLILFMDAAMMDDPYFVFNAMLEAAEQIAQDLHAELYQTPNEVMTVYSQEYYARKLSYAKRERDRLKEIV